MNEPWKLFLDDVRDAPEGWTLARSVEEAQSMVKARGIPVALSLDHDMEYTVPKDLPPGKLITRVSGHFVKGVALDPTGLDFADWFAHETIEGARLPLGFVYYVHTANNRARPMIRDRMFRLTRQEPAGYHDWWVPK
jgi:hypothetical protein